MGGICDYRKVVSRFVVLLGQQDFPEWRVTRRMGGSCVPMRKLFSHWAGWAGFGNLYCLVY